MRTLYIEGVAIHGGPESCAVVREGAGEGLAGVRAGSAIEPRNQGFRGADVVKRGGRQVLSDTFDGDERGSKRHAGW
jgi:hypothetical protein